MKEINNEITIRVLTDEENLIKLLESKGSRFLEEFRLDDIYYLNSDSNDIRQVLKNAIIFRKIISKRETIKQLVYKTKDISNDGSIISQQKVTLSIENEDEVEEFLNSLGYRRSIELIEDDKIYIYDNIGLVIKNVKNMGLLMEIETRENTKYDSIDKLKDLVKELDIPIQKDEYFIKKAEIALNNKGEFQI